MNTLRISALLLALSLFPVRADHPPPEEDDWGVLDVLEAAALCLMYGGLESTYAMLPDQCEGFSCDIARVGSTPRLPLLRGDLLYQGIQGGELDDVADYALTYRLQAGWGPVAAEWRVTNLEGIARGRDAAPVRQAYLLYRMSYCKVLEWDVGIGSLILEDEDGTWETSTALTSPVRLHFETLSVECINSWGEIDGESIRDNELALLVHRGQVGLRAGYRWIGGPPSLEFHGPFAGVTLFW